jgi:hypothetical protein
MHNTLVPDEPSWHYAGTGPPRNAREFLLNLMRKNLDLSVAEAYINGSETICGHTGGSAPPMSTAYTSLLELGPGRYLLEYDRLANGWHYPPGPYGDKDYTFAMAFSWTGEREVAPTATKSDDNEIITAAAEPLAQTYFVDASSGAQCLDGSLPRYWLQPSTDPASSNKWAGEVSRNIRSCCDRIPFDRTIRALSQSTCRVAAGANRLPTVPIVLTGRYHTSPCKMGYNMFVYSLHLTGRGVVSARTSV